MRRMSKTGKSGVRGRRVVEQRRKRGRPLQRRRLVVPARDWTDLRYSVRITRSADRRPRRTPGHFAGAGIPGGGAATVWAKPLHGSPVAVLAERQRLVSAFPVLGWRSSRGARADGSGDTARAD